MITFFLSQKIPARVSFSILNWRSGVLSKGKRESVAALKSENRLTWKKELLIQLRQGSLNFIAMSFISVVNHDMADKFL